MTLQRWDPFAGFRKLDNFNNRFWLPVSRTRTAPNAITGGWGIPLDVVEQGDNLVVRASVPGVKPEDIKVKIEGDVLMIRAEAQEETEHAESEYLMRERRAGSFYRALRLPDAVDQDGVASEYAHGVLTVTLPKSETSKVREIEVKVA
ncbi:MAG: Hsp20/alpha crystallin family protein [Chloroflexi bacterium]|nr:Hsp20/alpha crystallin family protein [Chloroflexota bacterium]